METILFVLLVAVASLEALSAVAKVRVDAVLAATLHARLRRTLVDVDYKYEHHVSVKAVHYVKSACVLAHVSPVQPATHEQRKALMRSVQRPPFRQGSSAHSLMLAEIRYTI